MADIVTFPDTPIRRSYSERVYNTADPYKKNANNDCPEFVAVDRIGPAERVGRL